MVSRELKRNVNLMGRYNAQHAIEVSEIRKERLNRPGKFTVEMEKMAIKSLREDQWPPEQTKGALKKKGCRW